MKISRKKINKSSNNSNNSNKKMVDGKRRDAAMLIYSLQIQTNMNIIWELEHETFFNRTTYSYFTFVLSGRLRLMVSRILHLLFFFIIGFVTESVQHTFEIHWKVMLVANARDIEPSVLVFLFANITVAFALGESHRRSNDTRNWRLAHLNRECDSVRDRRKRKRQRELD